jgi:hypothetical protein
VGQFCVAKNGVQATSGLGLSSVTDATARLAPPPLAGRKKTMEKPHQSGEDQRAEGNHDWDCENAEYAGAIYLNQCLTAAVDRRGQKPQGHYRRDRQANESAVGGAATGRRELTPESAMLQRGFTIGRSPAGEGFPREWDQGSTKESRARQKTHALLAVCSGDHPEFGVSIRAKTQWVRGPNTKYCPGEAAAIFPDVPPGHPQFSGSFSELDDSRGQSLL